jgi:hypothetical protein
MVSAIFHWFTIILFSSQNHLYIFTFVCHVDCWFNFIWQDPVLKSTSPSIREHETSIIYFITAILLIVIVTFGCWKLCVIVYRVSGLLRPISTYNSARKKTGTGRYFKDINLTWIKAWYCNIVVESASCNGCLCM